MTAPPKDDTNSLCERFDEDWKFGNAGPDGLEEFLRSTAALAAADLALLSELMQIDIERTWMSWSKQLRGMGSSMDAEDLQSCFQQLPKLSDYVVLHPAGLKDTGFWTDVAQCELESRNEWGDAIGPLYYAKHFQLVVSQATRRHANRMRCILDGSMFTSSAQGYLLRGRTEIGRQRRSEDDDIPIVESPEGNRIVVAKKFESQISREHLSIQLLCPDYAIVKNLSRINPVRVKSHDSMLNPQQAITLPFPFTLRLSGRHLQFYRSEEA